MKEFIVVTVREL